MMVNSCCTFGTRAAVAWLGMDTPSIPLIVVLGLFVNPRFGPLQNKFRVWHTSTLLSFLLRVTFKLPACCLYNAHQFVFHARTTPALWVLLIICQTWTPVIMFLEIMSFLNLKIAAYMNHVLALNLINLLIMSVIVCYLCLFVYIEVCMVWLWTVGKTYFFFSEHARLHELPWIQTFYCCFQSRCCIRGRTPLAPNYQCCKSCVVGWNHTQIKHGYRFWVIEGLDNTRCCLVATYQFKLV